MPNRDRMPQTPNYYAAQLTMLDSELKRYCAAVKGFAATSQPYAANASIYTLQGAIKDCMDDGLVLMEQAGHLLLNVPTAYGAWSRRVDLPFELFKGAEQSVYGRFSGLTHEDRAPYTPIAVLRTAIEIRIRSAFGVQGYEEPANNNFGSIDLSSLFEQIRPRLAQIQFAVDFNDIVKVYKWSNYYLHGGHRDFVWVTGFALQFLRPLFADKEKTPDGGWSIDGGIRMPRATWREIRAAFERPSPDSGVLRVIWNTIRGPFGYKGKRRELILNSADEKSAKCVFLD